MEKLYRLLVWIGRVPVFVGALALYVVAIVASAVAMSGRRAPAVAFSLLLVAVGMMADKLAGLFRDLFSTDRS